MKNYRHILIVGTLIVGLSGCQTAAERQAATEAIDHNRCMSMGFPAGSQNYWQCRQLAMQQRQIQRLNDQRSGEMLMNLGNRISRCGLSGQFC